MIAAKLEVERQETANLAAHEAAEAAKAGLTMQQYQC